MLANDARLIDAGPGAFAAHAARLAGLSKAEQDNLARSAVRIARGAFETSKRAGREGLCLRLSIVNLSDSVEVSMDAESSAGSADSNLFDVTKEKPAGAGDAAISIRWETQPRACLLTVAKTLEARNASLHPGTLCR